MRVAVGQKVNATMDGLSKSKSNNRKQRSQTRFTFLLFVLLSAIGQVADSLLAEQNKVINANNLVPDLVVLINIGVKQLTSIS